MLPPPVPPTEVVLLDTFVMIVVVEPTVAPMTAPRTAPVLSLL